jgi:TonB-linked SusC/RagA family outer membrane protein
MTNFGKQTYSRLRIFILLLAAIPVAAVSQQTRVEGRILDAGSNEPVIGATILLVDGKTGTVSDVDGNFTVNVPSFPVKLSVSYVGYKTADLELYEYSKPVTIVLQEDAGLLDEIVVVGYGTQRRRELTGAIATVSSGVLEHVNATSLDGLLGGAVAGLNVTQNSGQPGVASSIRIRGGNSVNASNDPLYVIDGFIFYSDNSSTKAGMNGIESNINPLAAINPSDIESVEILKDVSATAIYGSRGANGVILVTTKKGAREGARVNYRYYSGWDTPAKKLALLNASQWARMQKDFFMNKGKYTDEQIAQLGDGYDWQNAVLQTGISQTHELSVSGGDDPNSNRLRYMLSGSYTDQNGIILHSGFRRYNGRVNIDHHLTDRLTMGVTATAGKSTQNSLTTFQDVNYNSSPYSAGIANSLTYALYIPPVVPIYVNGDYNYDNPFEYAYLRNGTTANPVSDLLNTTGENINTTILGNFYARYNIWDGLTVKMNAGTYSSHITQNFFAPSYTALGLETVGVGGIGNRRQEVVQTEYMLTYTRQLNEHHFIDLLGGYTFQDTKTRYAINLTTHFTNEKLGVNNLADGASPFAPISGASEAKLYSLLGRVNYSLLGRYHLTATVRGDKSTRFAKNHRWGYFPSVGLSWNVHEESLLKDFGTLSNLKLRLTYGTVGNQEIGDYEYAQTFTASRYNGGVAYTQTNLGNENLKWETTVQYNAGVDAGLFGGRLSLIADVYYKKTSDLLLGVPVDPVLGASAQLVNVGNVTNRGVELAVNAVILEYDRIWKWSVSANIAHNVNRITGMGDRAQIILGRSEEEVLKTGESLGTFYGLVFDGIVQAGEDVSLLPKTAHGTAKPGDLKMADVSGPNGVPDHEIDSYDRVPLGNIQPKYTFGVQTTVDFRQFDLFVALQGSQGNRLYNHLRRFLESPNDSYNASAALLDSWTEKNPSNTLPGLANMANDRYYGYLDSRYVEDASFVRLKNITLGYTVHTKAFTSVLAPLTVRLFASAQNLFLLTGYRGYDPEVSRGIDLGAYPSARTFSIGAGISF